MTETFLALVPDYGALIVSVVVFFACLAVPLPASILVLTAGSFAAAGDLSLAAVAAGVFVAFVVGDQVAYWIAARAGRPMIDRLRGRPSIEPVLRKSETLLARRGALAVLMSHTVVSPTCPYITYLSGAGGLSWRRFSAAAIPGAALWTAAYVGLGAVFATQLEQVVTLLSNFFGLVLAACALAGLLILLRKRWRDSHAPS
ncbi:MAG: VTT domain-containing protein [Pseudomonadota bacterium]